jgi:glycosyltransferase involved in cell wall biosynthesis
MKVLHIISGDLWAGAEVQAFTLLTTLQKQPGIEVAAALMNEGELAERLRQRNISVTVLPENTLGAIATVIRLRKLMREWKPDIVHTHRIKENILGSIANRLERNVPSVRTVHGANEHNSKGFRQIHKRALNYLNNWTGLHLQKKIIAVSQELAEKLAAEFPREHITVIENGVDIEAVRAQVHPVEFRTAAPNATHIGIVGRLVPVKRVDLFLETAALLRQQHPERDWRFHIFGDGPLRAIVTQQTEQLALTDITTIHGHRNDIVACIAALDVLVMCSDHEGLPMTALEAVTVITPMAAHAVGGLKNLLPPKCLVSQQDSRTYANMVFSLLLAKSQPENPATVTHSLRGYSSQDNASNTRQLYKHILH